MFKAKYKWEDEVPKLKQFAEEGKSLQYVGDIYGVTRERMRQIYKKFGITSGLKVRKKNREAAWYRKRGDKNQDYYSVKRLKFSAKKYNALRNGIEFTLQFGDLTWPSHCPILGIEIDYFADGRQENSPSIDRIDSSKGYIPGNVQVVSWRANRIKNDGSAEEHLKIATYLSNLLNDK